MIPRIACAGFLLLAWSLPWSVLSAAEAVPATTPAKVDYLRDIKPILHERCFACHGALKQESGLRTDTAAFMKKGGDSGAGIVPGDVGSSVLYERISAEDEFTRMPPEGQPLTTAQLAMFRAWIKAGAPAPADEQPEADPDSHWAFQPPQRPAVPQWDPADFPHAATHPIDALLAAGWKKHGLKPVPLADRRQQVRRLYLDLIGLPPTRAEQQAFLDDTRPDAYERLVEQLLASPRYGERWGRHWMDVWRYSDWYGLGKQVRNSQKHIWHWRDWIVESLNEDKGYDGMVQEMLAADEIAPTDSDALRATGYLVRNYYLFNRTTWLDDTVEHTSKAFLGLTMNCAKCHHHKYDPLSHDDYFKMRAFFEPHQIRMDALPGETDLEKDGLPRAFDAHLETPTYLQIRGDAANPDSSRVIPPGVPTILETAPLQVEPVNLPLTAYRPGLREFVREDQLQLANKAIDSARAELVATEKRLAAVTMEDKDQQSADASDKPEKLDSDGFVLVDDFDQPNPDRWIAGDGKWTYEDGDLVQSEVGRARRTWRTRKQHPRDFLATTHFTITGGEKWHSVGIAFDITAGNDKLVYLSAVQPGSKLQVSYTENETAVYPPGAGQTRPVPRNKRIELRIAVRDRLVNVAVDGRHALAYELPVARQAGQLDLVAFDAAVRFHDVELRSLPSSMKLRPAGTPQPVKQAQAPLTPEVARAEQAIAAAKLAAAELYPAVIDAAFAADRAKYENPESDELSALIRTAATAARRHEVAKAELALAEAELKLAQAQAKAKADGKSAESQAKPDAAARKAADKLIKDRDTAQAALAKAEAAVKNPGEKYPSLRASRKAPESPAESEASINQPYPETSTGRRTALARWITDRRNPLAARVAVNHIWLRHFGQPLVDPVNDFGRRTAQPVQHELLDWLAVEFMEHGWSMKHLHRLIVTSAAYRRSSLTATTDEATRKADPHNEYYWRRMPMRMESQLVRDSILHLAGELDFTMGGAPVPSSMHVSSKRRSLYFTHSRDNRSQFLSMFDDADILACYRRATSIIPQQALTLANSRLSLSTARALSKRLQDELSDADDRTFVIAAWQTVLAGEPSEEEVDVCLQALEQLRTTLQESGDAQPAAGARDTLVHSLLNHNDFVTIR